MLVSLCTCLPPSPFHVHCLSLLWAAGPHFSPLSYVPGHSFLVPLIEATLFILCRLQLVKKGKANKGLEEKLIPLEHVSVQKNLSLVLDPERLVLFILYKASVGQHLENVCIFSHCIARGRTCRGHTGKGKLNY